MIAPFRFATTHSIVFEEGAASRLGEIVRGALGTHVLFVTDPGLKELGLADPVIDGLINSGIEVTVFSEVEEDPSFATVTRAAELARQAGATGVIGFGGGSSLDAAKIAALLAGSGEDLNDAFGVGNAKGPRLPLVLVPTTAGTGSEVTPVAIVTLEGDEKKGVSSPVILPDMAVLDPLLTLSVPPGTTAATGIDAMVHAIEAYTSKSANNNPISRALAVEALRLLGANIETVVERPDDVSARSAMLLGSMLAGQAFANSPVAAVHALAYPLGGRFHIPHGLSNALVLPHTLKFNAGDPQSDCYRHYADLAPHVFAGISQGEGAQAVCAEFISQLTALSRRLGLAAGLRDVGIPQDALPQLATDAMKQTRLLVNNPRELAEADALAIYEAAW